MMKKGMVLFLLLCFVLTPLQSVWGEGVTTPGPSDSQPSSQGLDFPRAFQNTWSRGRALGEDRAYVLDRDGVLWTWGYDGQQPQALCTLTAQAPQRLNDGECTYDELSPEEQAQAAETIQRLAADGSVLYALNQYAGRLGTVDSQGVHWLDTAVDARWMLTAEGLQRQILGFLVTENSLYIMADYCEEAPDKWNYAKILRVDRATGETTEYTAPDAYALCAYGEKLLLLCGDENAENWLLLLDPADGTQTAFSNSLPVGSAGGLAYDPTAGALYLTAENGVYRSVGQEAFQIILLNPFSYSSSSMQGRCLADGRYALTGEGVCVLPVQDAGGGPILVIAAEGLPQAAQQAYSQAYPDVLLDVRAQVLTAAEIADRIRSGDGDTDIFQLRVDSSFGALMAKGYAASLEESRELTESAAAFYPQIRAAITDDGGTLRAYPLWLNTAGLWECNEALWEKHFGEEPLPVTWKGLFEAMLRFEQQDDDDGDLFLMEWDYAYLMETVIRDFIAQREAAGQGVDFSEPVLRETLEALSQVNDCMLAQGITYLFEGDVYWDSEVTGVRSLFCMGAGFSTNKATLDSYGALPPFAFCEEEIPVIRGALSVLIVNPLSDRQELAREYIAILAKQDWNPVYTAILRADAVTPVENPNWNGKEEANRWKVSPEGLTAWQQTAPRLRFFERALLTGEAMNTQVSQLCARYIGGQLTLDGLLTQLNDVARLVRLEQQ